VIVSLAEKSIGSRADIKPSLGLRNAARTQRGSPGFATVAKNSMLAASIPRRPRRVILSD